MSDQDIRLLANRYGITKEDADAVLRKQGSWDNACMSLELQGFRPLRVRATGEKQWAKK